MLSSYRHSLTFSLNCLLLLPSFTLLSTNSRQSWPAQYIKMRNTHQTLKRAASLYSTSQLRYSASSTLRFQCRLSHARFRSLSSAAGSQVVNSPAPNKYQKPDSFAGRNSLLQATIAADAPRNDWTKEEIREIYQTPLMELVYSAVRRTTRR